MSSTSTPLAGTLTKPSTHTARKAAAGTIKSAVTAYQQAVVNKNLEINRLVAQLKYVESIAATAATSAQDLQDLTNAFDEVIDVVIKISSNNNVTTRAKTALSGSAFQDPILANDAVNAIKAAYKIIVDEFTSGVFMSVDVNKSNGSDIEIRAYLSEQLRMYLEKVVDLVKSVDILDYSKKTNRTTFAKNAGNAASSSFGIKTSDFGTAPYGISDAQGWTAIKAEITKLENATLKDGGGTGTNDLEVLPAIKTASQTITTQIDTFMNKITLFGGAKKRRSTKRKSTKSKSKSTKSKSKKSTSTKSKSTKTKKPKKRATSKARK